MASACGSKGCCRYPTRSVSIRSEPGLPLRGGGWLQDLLKPSQRSIPSGELAPAREVELRVGVVQMVLDRALGDSEMVRDLFVAGPSHQQFGDPDLRRRQRGRDGPRQRLVPQ